MDKISLCCQVLAVLIVAVQGSNEISCEAAYNSKWYFSNDPIPTCFFNLTTIVNNSDVVVKSDYDASGVSLRGNQKIAYLPIEMNKIFPNLIIIDASYCSIRKIDPTNFEGMKKLMRIWLAGNNIKELPRDIFKDLESLMNIDFRSNHITAISSGAITLQHAQLTEINFFGNLCIDRDFISLAKVMKEIATYCTGAPKKIDMHALTKQNEESGIPKLGCRRTGKLFWPYTSGRLETCLLNRSIVIDANNTQLDSTYNARGLYMQNNKNISYLPIDIYKVFPTLVVIDATSCSIKSVGPENLRNLTSLEFLWLRENMLDVIPKDTFKDLISLTSLDLGDNQIKSIAADPFVGLDDLVAIILKNNVCIDECFYNITDAAKVNLKTCIVG